MLHQIREQAEGATPTFLLQRMSPLLPRLETPPCPRSSRDQRVSELVVLTTSFRSLTLSNIQRPPIEYLQPGAEI